MAAHYENAPDISTRLSRALPRILSEQQRARYRAVFAAIDAEDWKTVETQLKNARGEVLYQVALAEYFTHARSPKVGGERIAEWFRDGVHLPQSEQLGRMGARRGLDDLPTFPSEQALRFQTGAAKRIRPRTVRDGTMPERSRLAVLEAIKNDDPVTAHTALVEVDAQLSSEARAEWRQRVAWSFYIENDDTSALAIAETVADGSGPWVAEGEWVAGLASWRLGYCDLAANAFAKAAYTSTNLELTAAAHYWAHRALIRCREPGRAQDHLLNAAQYSETLYGMLAGDQLGLALAPMSVGAGFTSDDWRLLQARPNAQVAVALIEVGQTSLADEVLRHEAKIGGARAYTSLARLARELGLPSTQLFMAHHAPYGERADPALRYPVASWRPKTGWRVDPALAFAHALQESNFRASAVSPANARGLMQIMPGTARDHNRRMNLGASYADLNDPEVNLAYGQRHLEMLRDAPATGGKLPKIMAAYNAGLVPVTRWNAEIRDFGDPLLWMESIPYWETRGYVAIVMRNYWMYERAAGVPSPSRRALAQGRWPDFPVVSRVRSAQLGRGE
ncbi:MAG: lytic transglycosylase domain-containing protein [Erythrobacter sp.]|uniref:lytic transglycosylase domain-containing protein n=1 Tax=Erythrobacter sp. TaxID=1042 RepID=UPI002638C526|nr:lytic transglycosylase domain-containing protein [Erythrobacter sp.]MDJ0977872.1 lytic transglycosylase domain-containing protein [Erythrobacter sp.]